MESQYEKCQTCDLNIGMCDCFRIVGRCADCEEPLYQGDFDWGCCDCGSENLVEAVVGEA